MGLLDYHAKNLLPTVWSPDGDLLMRFRAQIDDQVKHRFAGAQDVLLVGDAVSHYWENDSNVDVMVLIDDQDMAEASQQLKRVNGFPLADTKNKVYFWPIKDKVSPEVLAKHFGPVYSVVTGYWYGQHVQDEMELRRVAGVLQYVNWKLYRAKYTEDPFPSDWKIILSAFKTLDQDDQQTVMDELKYRVAQIDRNVTKLLKRQPKAIWKAAEKLDQFLTETEELSPDAEQLPRRVVLALLHRFRYENLLQEFHDIIEQYSARRYASSETTTTLLERRLLQVSTLLLQRGGGMANATDTMYDQIRYLLDNNRYVVTDLRKRRIAYRLYRRYYGNREE
jgi:hypothetical protein